MKTKSIELIALLLAMTVLACPGLITGTFVFVYEIDQPMQATDSSIGSEYVDLFTYDDYNDHVDELRAVEDISIIGTVVNNSTYEVTGEVWLSYIPDLSTPSAVVPSDTTMRIFVTPPIAPGATLDINWDEGPTFIENFDFVATSILDRGRFWIYGLGSGDEVDCDMDIDIVITFTTGY